MKKGVLDAYNRLCIAFGLLPFLPFAYLALELHDAQILLGPAVGFVPVDFLFPQSPSPPSEQTVKCWFWIAGISFLILGIVGFFKKPFGFLFALATWASTANLIVRLVARSHQGPIFE